MSDLAQAALIGGGIFAMVIARSYGTRRWNRHAVLFPVLMVAGFGFVYLRGAPLAGPDLAAYGVALALGLAFAAVATACTGVSLDGERRVLATTGPAFVVVWALALVSRLGFVWSVENVGWARNDFGRLMIEHHISFDAIAPFFMLWALTMVLVRVLAVSVRGRSLQQQAVEQRTLIAA